MTNLSKESEFFNQIAPKIRQLVLSFDGKASVSVQKAVGDYATEVDIAVENLIVDEINKRFPGDAVLAEEGHPDTQIPDGRIWIIDPICGTTNIGRGIKNFCSNIALADNRELIASCVVDHSQDDYFWSVGENKVFINDQLVNYTEPDTDFGIVVDIDMGALGGVDSSLKERHARATRSLLKNTNYMLVSLSSSLPFAYASIGKLDGFLNVSNHPWDVCAAIFLMQQSGGFLSDINGEEWSIASQGAVAGRTAEIHTTLVESLQVA